MKYIDTSLIVDPNEQQPFLGPSLNFLQEAFHEGFSSTIKALIGSTYDATKVYILHGCVLTGVATGSGAYSVTAGTIFFNGEIYPVDAVSGTLSSQTLYSALATTQASFDPVEFSDGNTHNVHNIYKWAITAAGSGSNAYSTWLKLQVDADWVTQAIVQANLSALGGTVTSGSGNIRYKKVRNIVYYQMQFAITFTGTATALTSTFASAFTAIASGMSQFSNAIVGGAADKQCYGLTASGGSSVSANASDASTFAAGTYNVFIWGTLEAQ